MAHNYVFENIYKVVKAHIPHKLEAITKVNEASSTKLKWDNRND